MRVRADLHLHTNLDPVDGMSARRIVRHSPGELFLTAQKRGLQVLALSHHEELIHNADLVKQAKKYGITLIPALEATIEGSHVVILNPSKPSFTTFSQLALEKKKNPHCFIYAPHPFYPGGTALGNKLVQNIDLFDGVEYCHFYFSYFNYWNSKAVLIANKYGKTVLGTSDAHHLHTVGSTYSVINTPSLHIEDIIASMKQPENVRVISEPVSLKHAITVLSDIRRTIAYIYKNK